MVAISTFSLSASGRVAKKTTLKAYGALMQSSFLNCHHVEILLWILLATKPK